MRRALLRFPHLSFIPPVPYPPLRGTFPLRGRLCIGDSSTLANGALETISPLSFIPLVPYPPLRGTFPSRGRLCALVSGTLANGALETIFSLSFIPLPPSNLRPFGVPWTAALSQMPCFHSAQTKTALRGQALQSGFWFYYSTVTDFARFLGLSTSFPLLIEV